MFADRNLINRRNVTSDVSSSYRPNRDFLWVVFQSRVIGAAISVLGFENRSSIPSKDTLPENLTTLSKASKLKVLHELSAKVVDNFVFKSNMVEQVSSVISEQEKRDLLDRQGLTPDGQFPLDESTKHSNNFVKQCIRNLGPNISETAVSRLCKAESSTRLILEKLDEGLQ